MDEYKEPYLILWRGVTAALSALDGGNPDAAKLELMEAQIKAEEAFITGTEE